MEKTKANFRALREMLGYTQGELADLFDVSSYTVKRWERPDCEFNNPPDDAWDFLIRGFVELCEDAGNAVDSIMEMVEECDDDDLPVVLAYYRTQEDLDRFYNVPGYKSRNFKFVNTITRTIATMLYDLDVPFEFVYKAEPTKHTVTDEDGNETTFTA